MPTTSDSHVLHAGLLALFEGPFVGVKFPGVDAEVLTTQQRAVLTAGARVESLRAELESARLHLEEEEARLERSVERAVAYLRIYAADDPKLSAELEAMTDHRPRATVVPEARRRARPRRASEELALVAAPPILEACGGE